MKRGYSEELSDLLFDVYVNVDQPFQIHKVDEYTIYIRLYSYFFKCYAIKHDLSDEDFMPHYLKHGLPDYFDFLEDVIRLLDGHQLRYDLVAPSGNRLINPTKGGFSCVM